MIDGGIAVVDLGVTIAEDPIMSSKSEGLKEFVYTWDKIALAWGGTCLVRAGGQMVVNRAELLTHFRTSIKGNVAKTQVFVNELKLLYNEIKLHGKTGSLLSHLDDIIYTVQMQGKLTKAIDAASDISNNLFVTQRNKIVVRVDGKDYYLGELVINDAKNIDGIKDIQLYDNVLHGNIESSLGFIDDVPYSYLGQETFGQLEVIKSGNHIRVRPTNSKGFNEFPAIRKALNEVDPILNSAGFDRYRFEKLLRNSDNLRYLEENAGLLPEIARKIKPKMQYTDNDILKIFSDAVNSDYVKALLPTNYVNTLKTFGKTEEDIVTYFRNYHNVYTKGEFFTQIEEVLLKSNPHGLTPDEAYAVWGYTTNYFYRDLNQWLREGSNIGKTTEITKLLKQALQKVPKYNGTAYRTIELKGADLTEFLKKYSIKGNTVEFSD